MAEVNDYQLDAMEDAAVNKSKNLKRAAIAGAAVLGAGATVAYGATHMLHDENGDELTEADFVAAADASADNVSVNTTPQSSGSVSNNAGTNAGGQASPQTAQSDADVTVDKTTLVFDEDGDIVATVDSGTVDGKSFAVFDTDLNGRGDVVAIDMNGNGVYEENEIVYSDNVSYAMGQGKSIAAVEINDEGEVNPVYPTGLEGNPIHLAVNQTHHEGEKDTFLGDHHEHYYNDDDLSDHYYAERGGEQYVSDSERNPESLMAQVDARDADDDFASDNNGGEYGEYYAEADTPDGEIIDYGYSEQGDSLAYDGETFDDSVIDA
ncbi:MAG: hypothetical protein NC204_03560 [Candidatus Amulumruptor caecigallinarius]|nr:hypothetical protein [Candidatus Amulumruptor caecigallinarius]